MRLRAGALLFLFVVAPPVCSGLLAGTPWTAAAAMARGGPSLPWSVTATAVWLFWLLLLACLLLELVTDGRHVVPGLESVQALAAGLIAGVRAPQGLHVFTVPTNSIQYEPLIRSDALGQDGPGTHPVPGRRTDATVPEPPPAGPPPFLAPPRRPASRSRSASTITRPSRYPPALARVVPQAVRAPVIPPRVLPFPLPPQPGSGHGPSEPPRMLPHVAIGVGDDGQPVLADLAQIGLGVLGGPGAYGAIRALVAAALTCPVDIAGPAHRILITVADLAALELADLGPVPELTVTAELSTALRHLSAEVLHRAWLASTVQEGTGPPRTLGELRSALPEEHLPTLLLVSTDPAAQGPALAALLSQGVTYGLGAILATPHPSSGAVHVAEDGTLPATVTTLRQLSVLSASATTAVLLQVTTAAGLVTEEETDGDTTIPLRAYLPSPPPLPAPVPPPAVEPPAAAVPARAEPRTGPPVQLCLFGPPRILTHGDLVTHGLRARALELMAYLALHPDGARTGTMIGELLPDASDDTRAKNLIYTVIGSVRELLRTKTGHDTTWFIQRTHSGYQLDDSLIDVDLWQVRSELATAAKTSDQTRRSSAVSAALEITGGRRFLDQVPWEWADTHILGVHHQLLEASRRLATDLADDDRTDQALTVLHDALAIDPYAEDLYQQLLRIHARRNDLPALHRAYQLLQTRLNDINARPSHTTTNLYTALAHRPRPHP